MNKNIAAIDIGSNSFHMIIAKIDVSGKLKIIERTRKVLRLNDFGESNTISNDAIKKAIDQLTIFKKSAQKYNAKIKAVATSAVREAKNKDDFLSQVFNKTQIPIEVINGKREAELIYLGIQKAIKIKQETVLCIDIGGGSTEIILATGDKIKLTESLNIGTVRLTKIFFQNNVLNEKNITFCKNYLNKETSEIISKIKTLKIDLVVGTSGTITAIALIKKALRNEAINKYEINGISFTDKDLYEIENKILSAKTIDAREKIKGLEKKRVDVIPAGVIILRTFFDSLKLKKLTVSGFALKEGIVVTANK